MPVSVEEAEVVVQLRKVRELLRRGWRHVAYNRVHMWLTHHDYAKAGTDDAADALTVALDLLASTEDVLWRPEVRAFLRSHGADVAPSDGVGYHPERE